MRLLFLIYSVFHLSKEKKVLGDNIYDAERIERLGIPVVQNNTGGACHIDGNMVRQSLPGFDLTSLDLLIIENVGNLVCPAEFKIGENIKVMLLSTPEGADKPAK